MAHSSDFASSILIAPKAVRTGQSKNQVSRIIIILDLNPSTHAIQASQGHPTTSIAVLCFLFPRGLQLQLSRRPLGMPLEMFVPCDYSLQNRAPHEKSWLHCLSSLPLALHMPAEDTPPLPPAREWHPGSSPCRDPHACSMSTQACATLAAPCVQCCPCCCSWPSCSQGWRAVMKACSGPSSPALLVSPLMCLAHPR